jgi:hypothetical protein
MDLVGATVAAFHCDRENQRPGDFPIGHDTPASRLTEPYRALAAAFVLLSGYNLRDSITIT